MKTKLMKMIMSSLALRVCVDHPGCRNHAQHVWRRADGWPYRTLQRARAKGLVYMDLRRVRKLRWEPVTKAVMQGLRFNGDGQRTIHSGPVNVGGTIIIDATGGVGTYTVAPDCTGTISITDGPSFNMYVGPGAQQIWTTQVAGGAGTGAGLGVGTATRMP